MLLLTKAELAEKFKGAMQKFAAENPTANGKRPPYLKNALVEVVWPELERLAEENAELRALLYVERAG